MQAMSVYRNWQIDSLEKSLVIAERIITTISDPSIFEKRDNGDGWTISEVLGHLALAEESFLERAKLTVETENPQLPYTNPDQQVVEHGFASQNALDVLEKWKQHRAPFLYYLRSLPDDDSVWERLAQHPRRGAFTLNDQLMLAAWHDTNHIEQIVKIINR